MRRKARLVLREVRPVDFPKRVGHVDLAARASTVPKDSFRASGVREVGMAQHVLRRDSERSHEVLSERPDGLALRVGERPVGRTDDLDTERIPVHVRSAVPFRYPGVPEDVVRRSDLVRGSVDVDDEMARENGRELADDSVDGSGGRPGVVEDDEFLGVLAR